MNHFGGTWTDQKMHIVESYAKAYLNVMKDRTWATTIYFDGFAGSGSISDEEGEKLPLQDLFDIGNINQEDFRKGTAVRILEISYPKAFDMYYFVEKDEVHYQTLKKLVKSNYSHRDAHVVKGDCNEKIVDLAAWMRKDKRRRCLAFVDPYGMSLNWSSIEKLRGGLGIDLWILVPTGMGANRVMVKNGEIPEPWLCTLESFLGLDRENIKKQFYKQVKAKSLFDEPINQVVKERDTVKKLGKLYSKRLKEVFNFVSEPFVMRNSTNSIMYHFMMATNNETALTIANDVIKPKYRI
jgi:three-Cys-motif partner protein